MFGPTHDLELLKAFDWDKAMSEARFKRDLLAMYYFLNSLMCITDQNGMTVNGCSFSERGLNTLLVVKATIDGIPQVAYCTEKFPTGCVVTFSRLYLEGRVKWYPDKFRKI